MKICIACGMPMKETPAFAMGDEKKGYCTHCANKDGSMHSFEQKKESMTNFIIKTQGLEREVAENAALSMMKTLPAWEANFE
jgi:TPP-dependent pyruvate/acetoin dehydrogenase alpha subunit